MDNFEKLSTEDDNDFISLVGILPKIDDKVKDELYDLVCKDNHQYGKVRMLDRLFFSWLVKGKTCTVSFICVRIDL